MFQGALRLLSESNWTALGEKLKRVFGMRVVLRSLLKFECGNFPREASRQTDSRALGPTRELKALEMSLLKESFLVHPLLQKASHDSTL